jgi:hypothetical protein
MENILILDDEPNVGRMSTTDHISEAIKKLGGTPVRLRIGDFAVKQNTISIDYDSGKQHILFKKDGKKINLSEEISSVLCWRPRMPEELVKQLSGKKTQDFYKAEWNIFLRGIYLSLQHLFWMNPYPQSIIYEEKAYQLKIAQDIGFQIPKTYLTCSLEDAYKYFETTSEQIIYKPFSPITMKRKGKSDDPVYYSLYTNLIDKHDFLNADELLATPNIFQLYVPKKVELRVICVGKAVMTCEIHSQQSEVSKHDWRRYDIGHTQYAKHQLPSEVEKRCLKLLEQLKLSYGCIDMVVTPNDDYVFLEVNPNGQFGWIEDLTKLPITENIARMLMAGSINYDIKRW